MNGELDNSKKEKLLTEYRILEEEAKKLEIAKEAERKKRKVEREIQRLQREEEKIRDKNEKLNKKRLDNDECYIWSELVMQQNSFVTIEETKEIWVYQKSLGYYTPSGDMYLLKLCADGGPRTNDQSVLGKLKMFIMGKSSKKIDKFVHPEHLMNLKNGVIDMNKDELIQKSPEYNFQNVLNINYNKDATCPVWEDLIDRMFSKEDAIRTQKWFGYHLLRENREQVMNGFVGPSGSGKSTILHILVELLGKENVTHFNLQDLNNRVNAYAIGRLYGKLANITFDMITTPIKDGTFEIIKNLTSCDRINARNIREAPFEFIPYAKLTFACNKLPYVPDHIINTEEFKRRIMITEVIKKPDFEKDPNLNKNLISELHSGGIFNWILEGRKKYLDDDGFDYDHENIPNIWDSNMYGNTQNNEFDNKTKKENLTDEQILKMKLSEKLLQEKNQELINNLIKNKERNKEINKEFMKLNITEEYI